MREGYIRVDESGWPVVKLTYPRVAAPGAMDDYANVLRGFLRRGIPYWTIVDISPLDARKVSASDRAKLAATIDEATKEHPDVLQCVAVVSDSAVLRMLYTAHLWIRRHKPYPVEVFATLEDAASWVKELRGV